MSRLYPFWVETARALSERDERLGERLLRVAVTEGGELERCGVAVALDDVSGLEDVLVEAPGEHVTGVLALHLCVEDQVERVAGAVVVLGDSAVAVHETTLPS